MFWELVNTFIVEKLKKITLVRLIAERWADRGVQMAGGTDHGIDADLCDYHQFISNNLLYGCVPHWWDTRTTWFNLAVEVKGKHYNSRRHRKPRIRRTSAILGGVIAT